MAERTLEEAAQALARGRQQLRDAEAERERLRAPFYAAEGRVSNLRQAVKTIEKAMAAEQRAHAIVRALAEQGIETDDPPVIQFPSGYGSELRVYALVAVAADGAGLYLSRPDRSHRYEGKVYARRVRDDDQFDGDMLVVEEPGGAMVRIGQTGEWVRRIRDSDDLITWQARGRGSWGDGTGPMKPLPPPDGGRWRWLKIREQEALPEAT